MKKQFMLAALALCIGSAANAAIITNGDFENGLNGWDYYGNVGVAGIPYFGAGNTAANGQFLAVYNANGVPNAILSQTFATTIGQIYQVSFDYGTNNPNSQSLDAYAAEPDGPLLFEQIYTASGPTLSHFTFQFTAVSELTQLAFGDQANNNTAIADGLLDNVVVTELGNTPPPSDVPEPASIALLSLGLAGMGALRRRQR